MKKGLKDGMTWNEQIKITVRMPDEQSDYSAAYQDATSRIAELTKKGWNIGDTYIAEGEQTFILETK